jgi:SAM-dependent methyltransferase
VVPRQPRDGAVLLAGRLPDREIRWLDAACGTGGTSPIPGGCSAATRPLRRRPRARGAALCRARGIECVARASLDELPYAQGSFDLVTCFEALYHEGVRDFRAAVAGFARVLAPGGWLLLREPAFELLRGSHDAAVHGARRFRKAQLADAARAAGLEVARCSYQNVVTFAPALVIRSLQRKKHAAPRPEADFDKGGGGAVGGLLSAWLALEGRLLRFASLPFGSSALCLARRPGT